MAPEQQQVGINLASSLLLRHCASSNTWTTRMFRPLQTCQYFGGTAVKLTMGSWKRFVLVQALGTILLAAFTPAAIAVETPQITPGSKAKVKGSILSRNGDLVRVREKSGGVVVVTIADDTKIERKKSRSLFVRHTDMDVTAMVPGLTIEAEGVDNSQGQLEAKKISFTRDEFAIEVAEEQQVQADKTAAQNAQSTANQGVAAANVAQTSATQAQNAADQASQQAQAAGTLGIADAAAVATVNQRVSDL